MRKILVATATVLMLVGCAPQPVYQAPQQVIASTCLNGQGIVIADEYCDSNYIAQQRNLAMQTNNQILLNQLLAYHMIYSSTPYTLGMYAAPSTYYNSAPYGYTVQRRSTYVTNVTNHTIVVNNGRATTTPVARNYSNNSYSATRQNPNSPSVKSNTPAARSYTPSARPSPSYNSTSSSRSYSSGSSSSRRR